jgi:hypothetical protein
LFENFCTQLNISIKEHITKRQTKKVPTSTFTKMQTSRNGEYTLSSDYSSKNNFVSFSSMAKNLNNNQQHSHDLFTATECAQIMTELINRLKSCKTKSDQLVAIAELTMKYLTVAK